MLPLANGGLEKVVKMALGSLTAEDPSFFSPGNPVVLPLGLARILTDAEICWWSETFLKKEKKLGRFLKN